MFERLRRLYREGRLTVEGLQNAVLKGWITAEEMDLIIRENATEETDEEEEE